MEQEKLLTSLVAHNGKGESFGGTRAFMETWGSPKKEHREHRLIKVLPEEE